MKTLRLYDSGEEVFILQKLLQKNGIQIKLTGLFDSSTQQAVIHFQSQKKMNNDGIVGYSTWEGLFFNMKEGNFCITEEDYQKVSLLLDADIAAIKAVQEVETGGKGGFVATGKPTILFEGHIFWKQLEKRGIEPEQYAAGNEDILFPKWNKSFYKKGLEEYARQERACNIHHEAALCATSWGMFQIMGFNYAVCGMPGIEEFVSTMRKSELHQLLLFAQFIRLQKKADLPEDPSKYLISAMRTKDWKSFANLYNGPLYAQNNYDTKIEKAYLKHTKE